MVMVGAHKRIGAIADAAQWLDAPTASVLTFIARRLESTRTLVVIGLREGFDTPLRSPHLPEILVGPLNHAASMQLLDQVSPELEPPFPPRIPPAAPANPL